MAEDVEEIVRGLSEAGRKALSEAGRAGFGFTRDALRVRCHPMTAAALVRIGICRSGALSILTPFGLAVRAHLIERNGDVG